MASRMDEFRDFVARYPGVKDDVLNGTYTWQKVYENWVILGEGDPMWQKYQTVANKTTKTNANTIEDLLSQTSIKNVINYVKKIDPDSISKTLNTIQKVLQITQSFGGNPTGIYNNNYNSWWD